MDSAAATATSLFRHDASVEERNAVSAMEEERPPNLTSSAHFDPSDSKNWLKHLDSQGYVVIKGVATSSDCVHAKACLWRDMEKHFGASRSDTTTWSQIPNGSAGILGRCLPQSEGAWHIRALDSVKTTFSKIWKDDDLIVSMDSVLLWLPWWENASWRPFTEGLHIDQNPFFKEEKICVQGMIPLIDVDEESGGLEVVPGSHLSPSREQFKARHSKYQTRPADWCPLNENDPLGGNSHLVTAKAGDLILWDSRLLHGGLVGTGRSIRSTASKTTHEAARAPELARLSITVCMSPRSFATEDVLKRRRRGFEKGHTFTHWPHEAHITSISPKSDAFQLTPKQALLL